MITEFKEVFDDIVYDWPFSEVPHPKMERYKDEGDVEFSYNINKTYIYQKDGKFYRDYKTDHVEITEEVFKKVQKLYDLLYGAENG